jgi:hypothetical protein
VDPVKPSGKPDPRWHGWATPANVMEMMREMLDFLYDKSPADFDYMEKYVKYWKYMQKKQKYPLKADDEGEKEILIRRCFSHHVKRSKAELILESLK